VQSLLSVAFEEKSDHSRSVINEIDEVWQIETMLRTKSKAPVVPCLLMLDD